MKQLIKDIIRQVFGWDKARSGKLTIGYYANIQMHDLKLDFDTLEDVFRHGRKVTTIIQDYQNYSISLGFRWDERKSQYVITSVRLYKREGVRK